MKNKLFLLTPPFTQLNTPYPATAYIKGFLNTKNIDSFQCDLGIEVILELFSKKGLTNLFSYVNNKINLDSVSKNSQRIFNLQNNYILTIDAVINFLQGKNPTLAFSICNDNFLPEASRFSNIDFLNEAFGYMGIQDLAKHLSTLYLEDISDFIIECVDTHFGFSRYAEHLGRSANSFDDLYIELQKNSYIDNVTIAVLEKKIKTIKPNFLLISVPFPGNLYSTFKIGQWIKKNHPNIKVLMGGGFPNTELRSLKDARVFEFVDYITLDNGELPIELICFPSREEKETYKRTFFLKDNKVFYENNTCRNDYKQHEVGTPDYTDLLINSYISVIEMMNPMHRLWSDGRWNKLTMAHGCYWSKCTFCDTTLDYISVYEPLTASFLCNQMELIIKKTNQNGFHFVDEAAPPALMRALALEIIRRKLVVTWWTNIRFEKNFTADLCILLRASGCIAVSGGLEVASDRLLKLIDKGVSVEQVSKITQNFTNSGIMVHAYLMYGYPTQTVQETIDSLEMVRQLFEIGILKSGFWHQFALTAHSPIGKNPEKFGISIKNKTEGNFANNDLDYTDKTGIDHSKFSFGLRKSLYNYMQNIGFELPLQSWFNFKIPKTTIHKEFIYNTLKNNSLLNTKPNAEIIWLGNKPKISYFTKSKREWAILTFETKKEQISIKFFKDEANWLIKCLSKTAITQNERHFLKNIKIDFETNFDDFELFWHSKNMKKVRELGLLTL